MGVEATAALVAVGTTVVFDMNDLHLNPVFNLGRARFSLRPICDLGSSRLFGFCNSGCGGLVKTFAFSIGCAEGPANKMRTIRVGIARLVVGLLTTFVCVAQETVNLWPGVAPGAENWTQKEVTIHLSWGTVLQNVVTPTLTAYLPEKSKATGTGVIVALADRALR
jgi:hypothetical protein